MKKGFKTPSSRPSSFRPSVKKPPSSHPSSFGPSVVKTPRPPGTSWGNRYQNYRSGGRRGCGGWIAAIVGILLCLACLAALAVGYYLVSQGIITIPGVNF